ncbi:MAG: glycosyltransferase family protein [Candidatus Lokiarchaeia archaeon]
MGIIVQARMGSTRLAGKTLMKLNENEKVLELLIKRLKLSKSADELIIATTPDEKNSLIIDTAKNYNVLHFVGSEYNVLERFFQAAKKFEIDIIVRITSDCPFVDPKILDSMVDFYKDNNYDYIMNLDEVSNFPAGFDIEIFSFNVLKKVFTLVKNDNEKEHVTKYIQNHPESFSIFPFNDEKIKKFHDLRLTIDYEEDLTMVREVYKRLKEKGKTFNFSLQDVLEIIEEDPIIMNINKHLKKNKN